LWDFHSCDHMSAHLPLVKKLGTSASFFYFESGNRVDEHAAKSTKTVDDLMPQQAGGNRRLAVDKIGLAGARALEKLGVEIHDSQEVCELVRVIKGIKAMRCAMHSCEASITAMRKALYAGQSKNDLWSVIYVENVRGGRRVD